MLDLMLVRLAQREREREIAQLHRLRAIREALARCAPETFVPPAPGSGPARGLRPASRAPGSL